MASRRRETDNLKGTKGEWSFNPAYTHRVDFSFSEVSLFNYNRRFFEVYYLAKFCVYRYLLVCISFKFPGLRDAMFRIVISKTLEICP